MEWSKQRWMNNALKCTRQGYYATLGERESQKVHKRYRITVSSSCIEYHCRLGGDLDQQELHVSSCVPLPGHSSYCLEVVTELLPHFLSGVGAMIPFCWPRSWNHSVSMPTCTSLSSSLSIVHISQVYSIRRKLCSALQACGMTTVATWGLICIFVPRQTKQFTKKCQNHFWYSLYSAQAISEHPEHHPHIWQTPVWMGLLSHTFAMGYYRHSNWGPLCWEPRVPKVLPLAWSRLEYCRACFMYH